MSENKAGSEAAPSKSADGKILGMAGKKLDLCNNSSYEAFERVVFTYALNQSKNQVDTGVLENLKEFYTVKDHSWNFFFEGSPEPVSFTSLDDWYATAPRPFIESYIRRQYIMANLRWDQETMRGSYWAYCFDDGKLAQLAQLHVQMAFDPERNGRLAVKHCDIYFNNM